ncbi:MAG: cation:proton antiporter [Sumerlaeia bacterium]
MPDLSPLFLIAAGGSMTTKEIAMVLLGLGVLLLVARLFGEAAQRLGQPSVLGELLAGVLLGPTLFGALFPGALETLFPSEGTVSAFYEGFFVLCITLFLLVAGLEVDLSMVWSQGKRALIVGLGGMIVPFAMGFGLGWFAPVLLGMEVGSDRFTFSLFIATALSISALPVIAKTLMDLNLYRSDIGMITVAAAIFNDLVGWIIFALILGMMAKQPEAMGNYGTEVVADEKLPIGWVIVLTLGFAGFMLTIGRMAIHRTLPFLQAHFTWPGSAIGLAMALALFGAAFTEYIGIHAIFGSFLVGVALGDSSHLKQKTRSILHEFISFIFAPLFFASVGLTVNFITNFDLLLTLVVLFIACVGKVLGCGISGRISGLGWRESWVLGFGLNARGTMEIILGLLALEAGLIGEELFVALVIMALVTSMMSGPVIQRLLKAPKPHRIVDLVTEKTFVADLYNRTREGVIQELSEAVAKATKNVEVEVVARAVCERESQMSTGVGQGIAVPHARIPNWGTPVVAMGVSRDGVDFDARDGKPAHLIFMIITDSEDNGAQLEVLADIGKSFGENSALRSEMFGAKNYVQMLALMKTANQEAGH